MKDIKLLSAKLPGIWEGIQGDGVYHEEWSSVDESSLQGRAYLIRKGEITNQEKLSIIVDNGEIYYVAEVSHNAAPVRFRLTSSSDDVFVFENPEHDFPQKITYDLTASGQLLATIEAEKNGKTKKIEFRLQKISD